MIKDRGLIKWQPALLSPEQRELIRDNYLEQEKVAKPELDEFELEEINRRLIESMQRQIPLMFRLFKGGFIKNTEGVVSKIDPYQKTVKITNRHGLRRIPFVEIVGVEAI